MTTSQSVTTSSSWKDVEKSLAKVSKFSVFDHLEPVNKEKQKELFLAGEIENPDFEYPDPTYDTQDTAEQIESIEIPEGPFEQQFRQRVDKQRQRNRIVRNRGNPDEIIEASQKIYGDLDNGLINTAEFILSTYEDKDWNKQLTSEHVEAAVEQAMKIYEMEYGEDVFEDWTVTINEDRTTGYASRKNQEFIIGRRDYFKRDPLRYVVHELGRHALLRENRRAQREREEGKTALRNFMYDSETEEGITTNLERVTGTENPETIRNYALRAMAVDSAQNKNSFRETYERLAEHESDEEIVWDTTLRAHRGGGFIKDHIYLQGGEKLREYLNNGGTLKPLYVGKVPLQSVDEAQKLMDEGKLKEPRYSPEILHDGISEIWD